MRSNSATIFVQNLKVCLILYRNNKLDEKVSFPLNIIFHWIEIIRCASRQKQAHHNIVMMGLLCLVFLNRNLMRRFFPFVFSVTYSRP